MLDRRIVNVHSRVIEHPATSTCNLQVDTAIYARSNNGCLEDLATPQYNTSPLGVNVRTNTNPEALGQDTVDTSTTCLRWCHCGWYAARR